MFSSQAAEQSLSNGQNEKRSFKRRELSVPLYFSKLNAYSKEKVQKADLIEVGYGGARIRSSDPIQVGDWIKLEGYPSWVKKDASFSFLKQCWRGKAKVIWQGNPSSDSGYVYGVGFPQTIREAAKCRFNEFLPTLVAILILLGCVNVVYLKWFNVYYFWYSPFLNFYSLIISIYILSRFLFAIFYKPPVDKGYQPSITVVISCKNEEDSIRRTIDCIYEADYPKDRLEVISVNDGSTDNTLEEMLRAGEDHKSLRIVNFKKNLGKRHGMAIGARMAKGEILVYIDSDSFINKDGLYKIVQGFAEKDVGAVCGHANVTNATKNALTKMQEVRYFVAFRVIKAAESLFSTVSCCSGCFAAYRREYVMPILSTWLNQKFLGVEATFGDDRSLTNFMLRKYRVIYSSEAVCTTLVPESYRVFFRQQLRWKKSWIRESLLACRFIWKRHPIAAFFFYCGVIFPIVAPLIVLNAIVLPLLGFWPLSYLYIYGAMLMAGLYSLVYLAFHRNSLWIYGVSFSFFYMLVLVWQTYYAFFTVKQNHWGTR